jgi:citrate synthase
MPEALLSARQAAARLGVSLPTLYAYVSRGQLRSEPDPADPRARLYPEAEVAALVRRKAHRQDPTRAAAEALDWGTPVLASALTRITPQGPAYRGRDVVTLAHEETFERVAALLWLDDLEAAEPLFSRAWAEAQTLPAPAAALAHPWLPGFQHHLLAASAVDLRAYDLTPAGIAASGARLLERLVLSLTGTSSDRRTSLASRLGQAWGAPARALEAALVACADHELNASSFTARVVAGAGATPYQAVLAGLAALSGHRHGGSTLSAVALLREIGTPSRAAGGIADRLRRGERLPGFGHPLYPQGDPRAPLLLAALGEAGRETSALAEAVARVVEEATGERPNLDLGLAALELGLALPNGAGLALFALGRTVGLVAHALEQAQTDTLIRPRARYVGRGEEDRGDKSCNGAIMPS